MSGAFKTNRTLRTSRTCGPGGLGGAVCTREEGSDVEGAAFVAEGVKNRGPKTSRLECSIYLTIGADENMSIL